MAKIYILILFKEEKYDKFAYMILSPLVTD